MTATLDLVAIEEFESLLRIVSEDTGHSQSCQCESCRVVWNASGKLTTLRITRLPQLLAAARDCIELHQQLAIIHASKRCGSDVMTPLGIELWARELGWKPGAK
jgi:hypothetical protein